MNPQYLQTAAHVSVKRSLKARELLEQICLDQETHSGVVVVAVNPRQNSYCQLVGLLLPVVLLDQHGQSFPIQRRGCLHIEALPRPGVVVDH